MLYIYVFVSYSFLTAVVLSSAAVLKGFSEIYPYIFSYKYEIHSIVIFFTKLTIMALHLSLSSAVLLIFSYVFSPVHSITPFIHSNLVLPLFFFPLILTWSRVLEIELYIFLFRKELAMDEFMFFEWLCEI